MAKVVNILVRLASHCDFCFKGSSTSFSENKLIVGLNYIVIVVTAALKRTEKSCIVFGRFIWWNVSSMKESCR